MEGKKILFLLGLGLLLMPRRASTQDQGQQSNQSNQNPSTFDGNTSYLNQPNLPRGIRNNNPGNLKISNSQWLGKHAPNSDGVFEQFTAYKYGVRAMTKLLINYIASGRDTIDKILNSYSSGSDAYKNYVSQRTGFARNQALSDSKENLRNLVQAMSYFENGIEAVNNSVFDQAYDLI